MNTQRTNIDEVLLGENQRDFVFSQYMFRNKKGVQDVSWEMILPSFTMGVYVISTIFVIISTVSLKIWSVFDNFLLDILFGLL